MIRDIPRRRLAFDLAGVPARFYAKDPVLSLVPTALSLVFPEGERFFVESVKRFADRIEDPELAARVADFAAQEGMHSNAHLGLNAVLGADAPEVFDRLERRVKLLLRRGARTHSAESRLAVTCALEHFTAVMAEQLLTDAELRAEFDPAVRGLWLWHALEELEHKSVAFDVYQTVDGSYARRVRVMALATIFFVGFTALANHRLRRARGLGPTPSGVLRTWRHFWLSPGYFRKLLPGYLRYYQPGFHPDQHDTSELVRAWRERLFGDRGLLAAELRAA